MRKAYKSQTICDSRIRASFAKRKRAFGGIKERLFASISLAYRYARNRGKQSNESRRGKRRINRRIANRK